MVNVAIDIDVSMCMEMGDYAKTQLIHAINGIAQHIWDVANVNTIMPLPLHVIESFTSVILTKGFIIVQCTSASTVVAEILG
jgi:hypothetical protein